MKVLLTGGSGQLGQALLAAVPSQLGGQPLHVWAPTRAQLDLSDPLACRTVVLESKPDCVLNAGAYTAVDRAEQESQLAAAINQEAPASMAEALEKIQSQIGRPARMLQISTDFVFSGDRGSPYPPEAPLEPLGVYGATKAAGERAVLDRLGAHGLVQILRTSWVYGPVGHNFCSTMLRLHQSRSALGEPIAVVADQVGCPTHTASLAAACWHTLELNVLGAVLPPILHWSDAGVASWYDFAWAIGQIGVDVGLLKSAACVVPIPAAAYPTAARRPSYSLLDCSSTRHLLSMQPKHWQVALKSVLMSLQCHDFS
jgi:dTDP-4-dehydrorhamnose reductase